MVVTLENQVVKAATPERGLLHLLDKEFQIFAVPNAPPLGKFGRLDEKRSFISEFGYAR
jgi:hypothetical protein